MTEPSGESRDIGDILETLGANAQERFDRRRSIKTFQEFVEDFAADPYGYLRCAARYCRDMFEFFGSYEVSGIGRKLRRWKLFDLDVDRRRRDLRVDLFCSEARDEARIRRWLNCRRKLRDSRRRRKNRISRSPRSG